MKTITPTAHAKSAVVDSQALEEQQQYLSFMLRGETYAINIRHIEEIIHDVPRMPYFICGVINLRGAVVPVIDLSARFGKLPSRRRNSIIIIEVAVGDETRSVGMMVDAVNAVLEIPDSDIKSATRFGTHIHADFITGIGKINGKFAIILNIQQVLSMDDMAIVGLASADELAQANGKELVGELA